MAVFSCFSPEKCNPSIFGIKSIFYHLRFYFIWRLYHRKKVESMANDVLGMVVPKDEQEEIKEFVATLLLLPKEDRAVLLSNANAFKVRRDIEKARE